MIKMFFEGSRQQYKCNENLREYHGNKSKVSESVDSYTTISSRRTSEYCHGERSVSPLTTTGFAVTVSIPKPAPRKTICSKQQIGFQSSHQFFAHYCNNGLQSHQQKQHHQYRKSDDRSQSIHTSVNAIKYEQNTLNSNKYQKETKILMKNHLISIKPYTGNHTLDNLVKKQIQASEETNESSSDDNDTEDSTDNRQDKPKVSLI